jgi:hypothetical protein
MEDASTPTEPEPEYVAFHVTGIRGLYVPLVGGIVRMIPNTPAAIESARRSLFWARNMLNN